MTNPHERASIGAISTGTLRPQDLLVSFAEELARLDTDNTLTGLIDDAVGLAEALEGPDVADAMDPEEPSWILDELTAYLNEFAPPYCHFGAIDGDGACFGFWPSMDAIQEDVQAGEVVQVSDPSELDEIEGEAGAAVFVSDHGNVTLYVKGWDAWGQRHNWAVAWEVV